MSQESESEHTEHEADAEDHFRWTAEHMHALAVLRRVEATLYQHEAAIQKHRLEIMHHEQGTGSGDMHGTHDALQQRHEHGSEEHERLLKAIFDLERLLKE
jgi:hypothetical protein